MAVKKAKETEVEVRVENPMEENVEVTGLEVAGETPVYVTEPQVEVDTTPIDNSTQATQKNVRIRMRQDHKCWVGTELFDLKKGQCYNVPVSVKKRLNKAGLLLPL